MANVTGASTNLIAKTGTTFGTAVQGGSGDRMVVDSINHSKGTEELSEAGIGSGLDMTAEAQAGATTPTVTIEKSASYNDAGQILEALLLGRAAVTNLGSGAYGHSIYYDANRALSWATIAFTATTASLIEYPSCTPTRVTVTAANAPNYVKKRFELMGNDQVVVAASQVNTIASLAAATVANSKRIVVRPNDKFRINLRTDGALADSSKRNIESITIDLSVEAEQVREIKNSAGNGIVRLSSSPPFVGTVTVQFRSLNDFEFVTGQASGTEFKADFTVTSPDLIGGSFYYFEEYNFPLLKIIQDYEYNVSSGAENPYTVVFKCMAAPSTPTGMLDRLPYKRVQNDRSTKMV